MKYLLVLSMVVGCGGGGGSGGVSPDELPGELGAVMCAKLAECCTTEEFMDETLGADSEAECRALFAGFGGLLSATLEDSIAAGRVVYHGDRMAECLDAMGSASCTEFTAAQSGPFPGSACQDPFEGQVEVGGTCANDFDCISEYCVGDEMDFEGNITFGACAEPPAIGQACDDGNECGEGAYCDFSQGSPTCEAPKSDGSECGGDDDECESGSCNANAGGPSTCGVPTTCDGM